MKTSTYKRITGYLMAGYTWSEIVNALNLAQIKTPKGKTWTVGNAYSSYTTKKAKFVENGKKSLATVPKNYGIAGETVTQDDLDCVVTTGGEFWKSVVNTNELNSTQKLAILTTLAQ